MYCHSSYWGYFKEEVLDSKALFVATSIVAFLGLVLSVLIAAINKEDILLYAATLFGLGLVANLLVVAVAAFFALAYWMSRNS